MSLEDRVAALEASHGRLQTAVNLLTAKMGTDEGLILQEEYDDIEVIEYATVFNVTNITNEGGAVGFGVSFKDQAGVSKVVWPGETVEVVGKTSGMTSLETRGYITIVEAT